MTGVPIISWTAVRRDPAPIIRAFVHHHSAQVHGQFEYIGPTHSPGDDGLDVLGQDRCIINLQGDAEKLTLREARLVARALAAGRNIERTLTTREDVR